MWQPSSRAALIGGARITALYTYFIGLRLFFMLGPQITQHDQNNTQEHSSLQNAKSNEMNFTCTGARASSDGGHTRFMASRWALEYLRAAFETICFGENDSFETERE